MDAMKALGSGVVGASVLTLIHQSASKVIPHAPRVDVIGRRAIAGPLRAAGYAQPRPGTMFGITLGAELVSNSLYYALVGAGSPRHAVRRGMVLGLLAGIGAVFLPPVMGLGRQPVQRTPQTRFMTVAWYLAGGLAAAAAARVMGNGRDRA